MREIGGYIEFETYHLPMLHDGAIALNCGRNALAYLLKVHNIQKLWIPKFICDSVTGVCEREGVKYEFYSIGLDFLPSQEINLTENDWLYFVNYYSQISNEKIVEYVNIFKRVIIDQAQSYFQKPIPGVNTLYTCRKYFGVTDGAFLYTNSKINLELQQDESFERMQFLLGRYERSASEFYCEYTANNKFFINEPIKWMSKLTNNLLHGIDYKEVEKRRKENYLFLHDMLNSKNMLCLSNDQGTFMYPFMISNGSAVRKKLQEMRVYIPTLWPDVFNICDDNEIEFFLAENILPLPVDQRYGYEEMRYIVDLIRKYI